MDIASITGPLLLTYLMNCGFQGILSVQIYTYYVAFPNDRHVFKMLVYLVFVLETAQTLITMRDAYDTFAVGLRTPSSLDDIRTLWFAFPIIGGLVAFIGQMFFAYRLRILSTSWIPPVIVTFFALGAMAAAMATGAGALKATKLSSLYVSGEEIASGLWNGCSAVCDIIITVYMFYYLYRQINHDSPSSVRARISRLIRLILETGLLTSTMATLNLLLFACLQGGSYFAIPSVVVAKLYANTMLLILNNRITIIGGRDDIRNRSRRSGNGPRGESRWKWRLDSRSKRHNERSSNSGDGITVLSEVWANSTFGDHLEVTHTSDSRK